ncbi:MAG: WYL domain-containing protein [Gemmatimonadetes bacterium]|nr:WYL domain-containing protein [Gemmatimonadota bacterium]
MKQIVRQLDILRTLQARRYGVNVHELAEDFSVTVRTVQRDLRDLEEVGFLLDKDRRDDQHVYYQLQKETGIPLNFPVMEVAAMIFAERAGLGLVGTPFGEDLRSAVRRLTNAMPEEMRRFLERAAEAYVPLARGHKPYEEARELLEKLHEAILERRVCRVSYRPPWAEAARKYEIEPLRLLHYRGGLYVISRVPYYDSLITQAVERFETVEATGETFEPPDHLPIEERVSDAFGVSYEEPMEVAVRFSEEQAPYIRERIWHPSQELEELPDGRVVLRLRAGGFFEIRSWVLSFGAAAEVLQPEELREGVREEMRAALGLLRKGSEGG